MEVIFCWFGKRRNCYVKKNHKTKYAECHIKVCYTSMRNPTICPNILMMVIICAKPDRHQPEKKTHNRKNRNNIINREYLKHSWCYGRPNRRKYELTDIYFWQKSFVNYLLVVCVWVWVDGWSLYRCLNEKKCDIKHLTLGTIIRHRFSLHCLRSMKFMRFMLFMSMRISLSRSV